ncbi:MULTISPECIES: hypothetical protein [unclassified Streptomyces]|uniref:hypothetical protein n=1 Tax=unclassified Streptomyces TaxID=2593676 RepID=UPI002E81B810|nr:hypothetical protein [Streptomyces sp. NBC_00589]WTI37811.1 hypothetical protein OIC96_23785 [Streptomyces sp. NBC_00775]WUB28510.1 hypothetical protein OHA51_25950 [Streptomyces sp. NBC_00589]
MASASGTIVISRVPEAAFMAMAFKVRIDGVVAGKVRISSTVEFPVTPGMHRLQVTIGFYASIPVTIDVQPGGRYELTTGTGAYLDSFFRPKRYLVVAG